MRSVILVSVLLLTSGGLVACGSDEGVTSPAPGSPTSGAASSSPSTATSAAESPSTGSPSTEAPTSDYTDAPATGQDISLAGISLRGPAGWQNNPKIDPSDSTATIISPDFTQLINVSSRPAIDATTLDREAQLEIDTTLYERAPKRQAPVTIAGQQWFHLAGQVDDTKRAETFGTIAPGGDVVLVNFEYMLDVDAPTADATTGSVLASVSLS